MGCSGSHATESKRDVKDTKDTKDKKVEVEPKDQKLNAKGGSSKGNDVVYQTCNDQVVYQQVVNDGPQVLAQEPMEIVLRVGMGFDNQETKEFINSLVQKGTIKEQGGIMDQGAYLFFGDEQVQVGWSSVQEVKDLLASKGVVLEESSEKKAKFEGIPIMRVGMGFKNKETEDFVNELVQRGVIKEEGGVMSPGVRLFFGDEDENIGSFSVDKVKKLLTSRGIQF